MIKKILLKNIGIGLLLVVVFNLVLFVVSLIFGFEDGGIGPSILPAFIFAAAMGLIVYGLLCLLKPETKKESFGYSISWSVIVFTAIILTTIANETTSIFFGKWYNYIVFIVMAIIPLVLKIKKKS